MDTYIFLLSILLPITGAILWYIIEPHLKSKTTPKLPSIDEVAKYYLERRDRNDPSKFYVVLADTDIGVFMGYLSGKRNCPIIECQNIEQAISCAKSKSVDSEGETYACVFNGKSEYLSIFNNGNEL
jgi:hypothetical protein